MDKNTKIVVGIIGLLFVGIVVFVITQPSGFVKSMTEVEKTESESLSDLANSVEIPYNSTNESQRTHYIGSLDGLYNATYNFKKL